MGSPKSYRGPQKMCDLHLLAIRSTDNEDWQAETFFDGTQLTSQQCQPSLLQRWIYRSRTLRREPVCLPIH